MSGGRGFHFFSRIFPGFGAMSSRLTSALTPHGAHGSCTFRILCHIITHDLRLLSAYNFEISPKKAIKCDWMRLKAIKYDQVRLNAIKCEYDVSFATKCDLMRPNVTKMRPKNTKKCRLFGTGRMLA
jgi:hypothetical protein